MREKKNIVKKLLPVVVVTLVMAPAVISGVGATKTVKSYLNADKLYWLIRNVGKEDCSQEDISALYDYMTNSLGVELAPTLEENISIAEDALEQAKQGEKDGISTFVTGNIIGAGSVATIMGGAIAMSKHRDNGIFI